jgi:hypothetical protein
MAPLLWLLLLWSFHVALLLISNFRQHSIANRQSTSFIIAVDDDKSAQFIVSMSKEMCKAHGALRCKVQSREAQKYIHGCSGKSCALRVEVDMNPGRIIPNQAEFDLVDESLLN